MTINAPIRGSTSMSRLLQIYYLYTWQSTCSSIGPPQCLGSNWFIICIHDNQYAHPCVHPSVKALTDLLFVYMTINAPIRGSIPVSRLLQIYYLYTWQSTRPSVGPPQCRGSYRFIICIHDNQHAHPWVHPSVTALTDLLFVYMTTRPSVCPYQCQGSYRFIICIHDNRHAHPCVHTSVKALIQIYYLYTWQSTRPSVGPYQCQGSYRFIICIHDNQHAHPCVHPSVKALICLLFVCMKINMPIRGSTPVSGPNIFIICIHVHENKHAHQ
jgi:hypothetical protein